VCVAVYSQWCIYVRFYFELQEIPSSCCHKKLFCLCDLIT